MRTHTPSAELLNVAGGTVEGVIGATRKMQRLSEEQQVLELQSVEKERALASLRASLRTAEETRSVKRGNAERLLNGIMELSAKTDLLESQNAELKELRNAVGRRTRVLARDIVTEQAKAHDISATIDTSRNIADTESDCIADLRAELLALSKHRAALKREHARVDSKLCLLDGQIRTLHTQDTLLARSADGL